MDNVTCSLTDDDLLEIIDNFKIDTSLKIIVPTTEQTIKMAPEGFVGMYHQFLKAGLRFPVFGFLKTSLAHYNLHVAQLAPNSFRKIICFVMLSLALGKNRTVDHPPELTPAQQLLVVNHVKWSDPDELMLGMAGLSTYWAGLGKQPIFMVDGKTVTLLDRLHRRKFIGATENGDRVAGRPPSHPGRASKDAYGVKKRSSAANAGGSTSPESEKSSSAPEEAKEVSPAKRRRLVRGGRHLGKGTSAIDQLRISSSPTTPLVKTSIPLPALYVCPVSSDTSMTGVPATSDASPTGSIVASKPVTIPPLIRKLVAIKAADSAFDKTLRGAGLGFGKFASAIVSSPQLLVSSEKHVDSMVHGSAPGDSHEAILDIPSVPSSPEAIINESTPDEPSPVKASPVGGRDPRPTLVSLDVAAPAFRYPYMTSTVGRVPGLGELSEEEGLDRACSLFMEGMHLAKRKTRLTHMSLMEEKMKLVRDLQQMELRNQELTIEVDGMREKQKEYLEVRQAVERQLEDVQRHREADLRRLEEVGQQFDSLKMLFSEKNQKTQLLDLEERVKTLTAECSSVKHDSLFYQQMSEHHAGDLAWLIKQGVVASVRAILNSEEFGNLNAACQAASIQVGLTQDCLEMKAKYPMLEGEPLLHSYPQSQEELMDRFSEMTGHEYQLLKMLSTGEFGMESLKKYLDDNGGEEVHMTDEGLVGVDDLKSVRADTKGSTQLNVDGKNESDVVGEQEDDGGAVLGDTDGSKRAEAVDEVIN
ncbi:hypothetical protein LXL04_024792 [Taraxacum kok-saghyz]